MTQTATPFTGLGKALALATQADEVQSMLLHLEFGQGLHPFIKCFINWKGAILYRSTLSANQVINDGAQQFQTYHSLRHY